MERDQTAAPAYDMSKAKVHIVTDAAMLPYHELDQGTTIPVRMSLFLNWSSSTDETLLYSPDLDIFVRFRYLHEIRICLSDVVYDYAIQI